MIVKVILLTICKKKFQFVPFSGLHVLWCCTNVPRSFSMGRTDSDRNCLKKQKQKNKTNKQNKTKKQVDLSSKKVPPTYYSVN